MLFVGVVVGVFLSLVERSLNVVGRSVDRVELHWLVTLVHHVVPLTCWNKDGVIVFYYLVNVEVVLGVAYHEATLAAFQAEELIVVVVHLSADLTTGWNGHDRHLQVLAGPQRVPECIVLLRYFLDIENVGVWTMVCTQVAHRMLLCSLTTVSFTSVGGLLGARLDLLLMTTNRWRLGMLLFICLLGAVVLVLVDVPSLPTMREWADSTGPWFPLLFLLIYIGVTQFPIPRTVLTLSAGVLFGSGWGIILALVATTISATVSLLVVRGLLRDWVASCLSHPKVHHINEHLERRGWIAILSLRMIAAVPFSLLNYVAALSQIRVLPFAFATLIGSAPGTIVAVLFGDTLTGEADPRVLIATFALAALGLVGLIADALSARRQGHKVD